MESEKESGIAAWLLKAIVILAALAAPLMLRAQENTGDPLPSWQNGQARTSILNFVREVTDRSSPKYVRPEERIAAFDDGGTLWTEWPLHVNQVQVVFARQRVKELVKNHPEWKFEQPFKAILEGDDKELAQRLKDPFQVLGLLRATHGGMTVDEFSSVVQNFLATAKHPKFKVPYTKVAYQPMLELLALLRANEFKVYIVTGGGADFIRELSEQVYGVPRENVIGSSPEYEFKETAEGGYLVRRSNVATFNEKAGKAENIQLHIGRRPIFVAGNTNSDLAMMELAAGGKKPFLNLLVRHDDSEREFAYEDNTDKAIEMARARGWTIVSMKSDFKGVFSFQKK